MTRPSDWTIRNDKWQQRHFLMSSFVRNKEIITSKVYEFIDHLIEENYHPPLDSLDNVDREIRKLYEEYV